MDFNTVMNTALNVPTGSPPYNAAEALCRVRGIDPWGVNPFVNILNWKAVIVEQMCAASIARELMPA